MIAYLYILKEHIAPFIYSIGVITFIFIMDLAIQLMDSILTKGLNPRVVLEVFVLNLSWMVALSVPMSFLVATLMAFGRFSADNEITALKASGLSIYSMILPPFLSAGIICVGMIYFNNTLLPESNHKASVLMSDISRKKPAAFLRAGTIISDFKGYRIFMGKLDPKTSHMESIRIYEEKEKGNLATTFAAKGTLKYVKKGDYLQFTLVDGETHQQDADDPQNYFVAKFKKQIINIKNTEHQLRRTTREYRGDRELSAAMMRDRAEKKAKESAKTRLEALAGIRSDRTLVRSGYAGVSQEESNAEINEDLAIMSQMDRTEAIRRRKQSLRRQENSQRVLKHQRQYINRYWVEIHKKYSIPAACLAFVLIGAPLGIKARTGGFGVGAAYSIAFFVLYWACFIGGETLADKGRISPFWAMWAPNVVVGGSGALMVISMVRETTFFSYRWMGKWGKKLGLRPEMDPETHAENT